MRMRVIVTEQDWMSGNPERSGSCPIALAIRRMFPRMDVSVGRSYWFLSPPNDLKCWWGVLPPAAAAYVKAFDNPATRNALCVPITDLGEFVDELSNDRRA